MIDEGCQHPPHQHGGVSAAVCEIATLDKLIAHFPEMA